MRNASKHVGFIFLLAILALLYIANAHRGERKLRRIAKLKKEVHNAKSNYQEVKSGNTYNTTESQLKKRLAAEGLKVNEEAPILIKTEK